MVVVAVVSSRNLSTRLMCISISSSNSVTGTTGATAWLTRDDLVITRLGVRRAAAIAPVTGTAAVEI